MTLLAEVTTEFLWGVLLLSDLLSKEGDPRLGIS